MKKILIFITLLAILATCATLALNAEEILGEFETVEEVAEEVIESPISAEMIKGFILTNLDKICSAISVALCAVLAWLYKKGFLPVLANGFKQFSNKINETKDGLTKVVDENRADITKAVEAFDNGVNAINDMAEKFTELQKLYEAQEANNAKLEAKVQRSDEILLLLCNAVRETFNGTKLPQYQKDNFNTVYASAMEHIKTLGEAVSNDETNT